MVQATKSIISNVFRFIKFFVLFCFVFIAIGFMFDSGDDTVVETVVAQTESAEHTACRTELHSENPYGGDSLVWDNAEFGTYEDGDIWVGYNRKTGDNVWKDLRHTCYKS